MIRIIEGGFYSGLHEMLRDEIRAHVEEGKRVYLIVPEQQAVVAECEFADFLPDAAPLFFEVTNFTRLANTVFRGLGGADAEYCDNEKKALVMWRVLTELSAELTMTGGRREINAGTVDRALAALKEMQSLGIGADELEAVIEGGRETDKRLGAKISDLSLIMSLYKKMIREKYSDNADDVAAMTAKLRAHPGFFDGALFYVEGFTSFTEPQYDFLGLISKLECVSVGLTLPRAGSEAFEYTEVQGAKSRLITAADKEGAEKKLIRLADRAKTADPLLSECCSLLWRTGGKIDNNYLHNTDSLRIFECETPYAECELVAADIRGRVAKGAKFKDFAIVARRAEGYVGLIDNALESAGVPCFISKKRDVASFEAIKLIYTAFAVISGGYKKEDVISYAKCAPCGISREACDEFELYVEKWQINGRRFTDGVIWNMNPDGYTVRRAPDIDERLLRIDQTRKSIIEPLTELANGTQNATTVRDFATTLVNFLDHIGLCAAITKRSEELMALGEEKLAEENSLLWGVICSALDTLVEVLGDADVTTDGFLAQLKVVFANADVGRIPAYSDAVMIGSADMIRLSDKKHVYMIGVNRGEFPLSLNDNSYFSDRDKLALSTLGLPIEPDRESRGARELFSFSRAFSYAKESVTLLYSTKNASLKERKRGEVIDRIIDMTDGLISPIKASELAPWETIYSTKGALAALGDLDSATYAATRAALVGFGEGEKVRIAEENILNDNMSLSPEGRDLIYGGPMRLSQSKIDSYNSCPLSYFCKYDLSLLPDERAEFDARNIGSFIHAILENFFAEVVKKDVKLDSLDTATAEDMVKRGAEKYLLELCDGGRMTKREELLLGRLCRTAMPVINGLCDEFRGSQFVPRFFELKIKRGLEATPEPIEFKTSDGESIFIGGSIDRVDTFTDGDEVYVRVVDYKTGKKEFSPSDIDKGRNLQMFLYLKAIVDTKNKKFLSELGVKEGHAPIPAGVIYVKTEVGDVRIDTPVGEIAEKAVREAQTRNGMILGEDAVYAASDARYLPIRLKTDGTPYATSADKVYTRAGWDGLCLKLKNVVESIADRMKSGDVSAKPLIEKGRKSPCEYCEFRPICRNPKL
jgi:ATP-dependent helicase/nuclease subunit B